jgi:GAF domain-containing protein
MGGAGIMLMADDAPRRSLCTTNEMSDLVEQLQYTLGEGPCVDAYRQGRPVIEPDLVGLGRRRWPAFAPAAIEAGVRAVVGLPLKVGAVRLGALNLCRDRPGPLNDGQHANALVMADLAAEASLVLQASAARGNRAADLGEGRDFHYVVHQAAGVLAAQLDLSVR